MRILKTLSCTGIGSFLLVGTTRWVYISCDSYSACGYTCLIQVKQRAAVTSG